MNLIEEIRSFLTGLKQEAPELFKENAVEDARELFTSRACFWAEKMGVRFNRIFIKDQKTLWGSCSAKGNLNFNRRVARAPAEIVDYLVIHELAHLLEMNHSKRFWAHVARQCPDYKAHRKWLRLNGARLKANLPGETPQVSAPERAIRLEPLSV